MNELATVLLLGLAAARGTQLAVWDSILDHWRGTPDSKLERWHADGIGPDRSNRGRQFLLDLMSCIMCAGFHVSWLTVAAWYTVAGRWDDFNLLMFGLHSFAVAGVQVTINLRWDRS